MAMVFLHFHHLLHQAQQEIIRLSHIISDLEKENEYLRCDHEASIDNSVKLCSKIEELKLEKTRDKIKVEDNTHKSKDAEKEILSLKEKNRNLEVKIQNFNTKLSETRSRLYKEKSESEKALKTEIKEWK
jgi:chromosome segregation ATPase